MYIELVPKKIQKSFISPKTFWSRLFRDCILFVKFPIDFLLTFTDSLEKTPAITKANKDAHNAGQKLLGEINNQITGEMKAYFIGSSSFKIIGIDNDLDFLAEYSTEEEKEKWKKILDTYFGAATFGTKKFTKWESVYEGFPVEVVLSNPKFQIFRKLFNSYKALNTNPEILAAYEKLKRDSAGESLREYNRRQLYFFRYYVKNKVGDFLSSILLFSPILDLAHNLSPLQF